MMQVMVSSPTSQRWVTLPDASGVLVVAAQQPLFVDASGTVSLSQTGITAVGALSSGSLARGFGMQSVLQCCRLNTRSCISEVLSFVQQWVLLLQPLCAI